MKRINEIRKKTRIQKPKWLKKSLPSGGDYQKVNHLLSAGRLHTVCQEANCPNKFECFSNHVATFMILGAECTRNCRFCNVKTGKPAEIDPGEPERVAKAALELKLEYVVVTSVTRDDLDDGGAGIFARTIRALKETLPGSPKVEVLIPDFQGDTDALKTVLDAGPDVLNHNIETVPSLYPEARPEADYQRSLNLFRKAKNMAPSCPGKSGLMVGLGETIQQVEQCFSDLYDHGCDMVTVGQYLQPTRHHLPVQKFYHPKEFEQIKELAEKAGIRYAASGPFVRSSYQAKEMYEAAVSNLRR